MSNKGFMLVEMCIVMIGISMLACIVVPAHELQNTGFYLFGDRYLEKQSQAILHSAAVIYQPDEGPVISFNADGNVNMARTITFSRRTHSIVVELGGGRLVYQ